MMAISLLVLMFVLVLLFCLWRKKRKHDDLISMLEEFIKWNRLIQTKDAMKGFYYTLKETLQACGIQSFNMNLTKEEFEKLSLEKMRELNETALNEMIFELKK